MDQPPRVRQLREESVLGCRRIHLVRWRCGRHLELAPVVVAQAQSHNGDIGGRGDPEHSSEVLRQRLEDLVDEPGYLTRWWKRPHGRGGAARVPSRPVTSSVTVLDVTDSGADRIVRAIRLGVRCGDAAYAAMT